MTTELTAEEVRAAIARVPRWNHSIELAPGLVTPGGPTHRVLRRLGLPADLTGKTVLDVGCSDGFFAFECERRGASRVVAVDDWSSPFVNSPEGFQTAHRILGSKVEYSSRDLQTLDPAELGQFDIVLCLGVLYHLRHPLLGMEQLARLTREVLYLETEVSESLINRPILIFIEGRYRGRDLTTWWVPTISCVQQMARSAGFQRAETVKIYDTRAIFKCYKDRGLLIRQILAYPPEEIAAVLEQADVSSPAMSLAALPWEELHRVEQQLLWNQSLRIAQSKRAAWTSWIIRYGAFRWLLSGFLDVLRALRLRYR